MPLAFRPRHTLAAVALLPLTLAAQGAPSAAAVKRAGQSVTAARLLQDVAVLSSDAFEGRAPGTRGEDSATSYIARQFREIGLTPGNGRSYIQPVPLVGTNSTVDARITVRGSATDLRQLDDIVAWSQHAKPLVSVKGSDVVFVGYGVVAPEFGWDDFKGLDVRGKTIVVLIGDPPIPDPRDSTKLDTATFRGDAMTYYGRWSYKYETGAARGAAAVLIVHETRAAGYPWATVQSNVHERFEVAGAPAHPPLEGWIQRDVARSIFRSAGKDFDALERTARTRAFRPVALGATLDATVRNTVRRVASKNVVATLRGSDPKVRNEYVLFTAHWDAYGIGRPINGDSIYNGALDDATGVAWMLATARALKSMPEAPRRTTVFLAVTAEEQGLLGSRYYAQHPLFPLAKTLADINMDIMNPWGRTRSIVSLGYGQSSLEDLLAREAADDDRTVKPDPEPEKGYFYRADHFAFARFGVPALSFLFPGSDWIGQPADYGARMRGEYVSRDYHKPSDDVKSTWNLEGMVDDTRLLLRVGLDVANGDTWPTWNAGNEFRARREAMLRAHRGPH